MILPCSLLDKRYAEAVFQFFNIRSDIVLFVSFRFEHASDVPVQVTRIRNQFI